MTSPDPHSHAHADRPEERPPVPASPFEPNGVAAVEGAPDPSDGVAGAAHEWGNARDKVKMEDPPSVPGADAPRMDTFTDRDPSAGGAASDGTPAETASAPLTGASEPLDFGADASKSAGHAPQAHALDAGVHDNARDHKATAPAMDQGPGAAAEQAAPPSLARAPLPAGMRGMVAPPAKGNGISGTMQSPQSTPGSGAAPGAPTEPGDAAGATPPTAASASGAASGADTAGSDGPPRASLGQPEQAVEAPDSLYLTPWEEGDAKAETSAPRAEQGGEEPAPGAPARADGSPAEASAADRTPPELAPEDGSPEYLAEADGRPNEEAAAEGVSADQAGSERAPNLATDTDPADGDNPNAVSTGSGTDATGAPLELAHAQERAGSTAFSVEISQSASGRGLVRMSAAELAELALVPGDTVRLTAARSVFARAVPGEVEGGALRIDPSLAARLEVSEGGAAMVAPARLEPIEAVVLVSEDGPSVGPDDLLEALYDQPLAPGETLALPLPVGRSGRFTVQSLSPDAPGLFTEASALTLARPEGATQPRPPGYEALGGLRDEIARVHEMIAAPLERPDLFERLGITPPRGIPFTGPPGTGKTLLARTIAAQTKAAFYEIAGPEIVSKHYGESEAALRSVFDAARADRAAIIFIDEIDAIAPRRAALSGEKQVERRVVAQLLTLMDGLSERGQVIVMAATNLPDAIDPALRRPGRFDREIPFRVPDAGARHEILEVHFGDAPLGADVSLEAVADRAAGYTGADLSAVAREAALASLARALEAAGGHAAEVRPEALDIRMDDIEEAMARTGPSALRDAEVTVPATGWADIGGLEAAKRALAEAVLAPHRNRQAMARLGLAPARGILLTGPPGSGKTLLARALAGETGMNFLSVRATAILSQYLGEAERAVADIFAKARNAAPAILFFDELDALAPRRGRGDATIDRIVAQMLVELDGLSARGGLVALGATNRPGAIDPALTRPGRFDLVIPIPLPDCATRRAILEVHLGGRAVSEDVDLDALAAAAEGLSGADLTAAAEGAARAAFLRAVAEAREGEITAHDLATALARMHQGRAERAQDFIGDEAGHEF